MDPNVTLAKLTQAMHDLDVTRGADEDVVNDVVDAWNALSEWIMRGGFFPSEWTEAQRRALENTRNTPRVCPPPGDTVDEISGLLESNPWNRRESATRDVRASTVVFGFNLRGDA